VGDDARPAARLKLAHLGPLPPIASPLAQWDAALLPELARHAEVGAFVEGYAPDAATFERIRVHDLAAVHWRNALCAYDLAIYELADDATADFAHDALCQWPGIVVLHGEDPRALFTRVPALRRAVLEQSLALVVRAPGLRDRLRAAEPWTNIFTLDHREPGFAAVAAELVEICTTMLAKRAGWIEESLETACAEMPSFAPGDVSAPWRREVDELSRIGNAERTRSAQARTNRRR
jgi:hypothetical protein